MMRGAVERAWFHVCLLLGSLLRRGGYSKVRIVQDQGERRAAKRRQFHAPLLISIGNPLMRLLGTGVRVLPRREWQERERRLYWTLYGTTVRIDPGGTLLLPWLAGQPLAALLENPGIAEAVKARAIEQSAEALADFHRRGFTHADAMAENVMIDLEAGSARWFDFETMHESGRSVVWQRADDVRALLATCVRRTPPESLAGTLQLIVNAYADVEVTGALAASFEPGLGRPLVFHLAQAPLPFATFREIARAFPRSDTK